jgi:hypothetical protein
VFAAKRQMVQRAFRAGKIDQHIKIIFYRRKTALHRDARFTGTGELTGIAAQEEEPSRSSAAPSATPSICCTA